LKALGSGLYTDDDLAEPQSEWVAPLKAHAFGVDLWTIPPNSQGYLTLGAAELASRLDLPADPNDRQLRPPPDRSGDSGGFSTVRRRSATPRTAMICWR
jgi:hypothetical protein